MDDEHYDDDNTAYLNGVMTLGGGRTTEETHYEIKKEILKQFPSATVITKWLCTDRQEWDVIHEF